MKLKLFISQLSAVDMSQFPKTRLNVLLITAIWEKTLKTLSYWKTHLKSLC